MSNNYINLMLWMGWMTAISTTRRGTAKLILDHSTHVYIRYSRREDVKDLKVNSPQRRYLQRFIDEIVDHGTT